jgi:hypothetical protein
MRIFFLSFFSRIVTLIIKLLLMMRLLWLHALLWRLLQLVRMIPLLRLLLLLQMRIYALLCLLLRLHALLRPLLLLQMHPLLWLLLLLLWIYALLCLLLRLHALLRPLLLLQMHPLLWLLLLLLQLLHSEQKINTSFISSELFTFYYADCFGKDIMTSFLSGRHILCGSCSMRFPVYQSPIYSKITKLKKMKMNQAACFQCFQH